jgi:HK97 family phage portal protein
MNSREIISRVGSWLVRAAEGEYRPGPYYLPITGGWLSSTAGSFMNWWQLGYDPQGISSQSAMVEACISAYAQTVAMLPGDHWRLKDNGGRERVTTSALSRILRHPNEYQSISDFLLNATRSLYAEGNAYALAQRNDRFEVDELHLMDPRQSAPQIAETGDVFYRLGGNDVIEKQIKGPLIVPARDVLHIRLHCIDRKRPFPLIGETPLTAALMDMTAGNAIQQQQIQFYLNQARPSAVLSTDQVLKKEQVDFLRQQWNEQSKGLEAGCGPGGTPILTAGLKVQPWATVGKDAQVAEVMKISDEKIALAFRVPLAILGIGGTPYASTELLLQSWLASGLGFALAHIEEAFGVLFQLRGMPDEYVEFDTSALLRSATQARIEALVRGVQGGVYAPDEAREMEGLPAVPGGFGREPRVQAQVVPLSAAAGIPSAPTAPGPGGGLPSAPGVSSAEEAEAVPKDDEDEPPEKKPRKDYEAHVRDLSKLFLHAADAYVRRDFCQDPETGLLCGSEPSGGSGESGAGTSGDSEKPESTSAKFSSLKTMPKEIEGTSIIKKSLPGGQLAIGGSGGIAVSTSKAASAAWKDMKAYQEKAFKAGWSSSSHPNHVIWHELAHVKVKTEGSVDQDSMLSNLRSSQNDHFAKMAAKVSKYAGVNGHEFVAEVFAATRAGRELDPDVKAYYKFLNGPKP